MKICTKIRTAIIVVIIGVIIAVCPCVKYASAEPVGNDKLVNGMAEIKTPYIRINTSFGFCGYSKYGNNIPVNVDIISKASEYQGIFRIMLKNNKKISMVQKKFSIGKNSKLKLSLKLPVMFYQQEFSLVLCDKNGKQVVSKNVKLESADDKSDVYVGIISSNIGGTKYFNRVYEDKEESNAVDKLNGKVFQLSVTDLSSKRDINMLDLIVIDYDKSIHISYKMINNLQKWVCDGGTLLLSGDMLFNAKNKYIFKKLGIEIAGSNYASEKASICIERKDKKYVVIETFCAKLKHSEVIFQKSDIPIISKTDIGKGNIMLSNAPIHLSEEIWNTYGKELVCSINNNFSKYKKMHLKNGLYSIQTGDSSFSYIFDTLKINSDDNLPNLRLYGIILIIYMIIAGPFLFIYYKKRGKTTRLWFMVPATSIIFSFIIYLLGTSTRIQKPFINFVTQVQLNDLEKNNSADTIFSVTNAYAKKYDIPLKKKCIIAPSNLDIYYDSNEKKDNICHYGVDYSSSYPNLVMNDMSAFEKSGFIMKYKTDITGNVEINVSREDEKLHGSITNKLKYNLSDCIIFFNGNFLKIGQIKAGETINIDNFSKKNYYMAKDYDYELENQLDILMGGNMRDTSLEINKRRQYGVIEEYLSQNEVYNPFFYGFLSEEDSEFQNFFEFVSSGVTGVAKKIDIKEKADGYNVIGSLEKYVLKYNENYTDGYYINNFPDNDISVTYKFPDNFNLKKIVYSAETAGGNEFTMNENDYIGEAFIGSVYARSRVTGEMVKLFDTARETIVDNMEGYLNKDNTLTLYYYIDSGSLYNVESYCLPKVKLLGEYR